MSRRPPSTEHSSATLACLQARRNELEQLQRPPDLFSWMASSRLYGDHKHRSTRSQSRETIRQARLSRPAISGTSISATLARFRPDCRQYFPNSVLAGWPVTGDFRPVLRPLRNEFPNGVRPADRKRHAEYLRLEVPLRKAMCLAFCDATNKSHARGRETRRFRSSTQAAQPRTAHQDCSRAE